MITLRWELFTGSFRQYLYDQWFRLLSPHLVALFPSSRVAQNLPFGAEPYLKPSPLTDAIDQPTWSFLATFAVHASVEQQQTLVTVLRDKVLENVISASKGWNAEENARRLANVNLVSTSTILSTIYLISYLVAVLERFRLG